MMIRTQTRSAAVIVAHPDDETLWAGGTILSQPSWRWFILSLCRGSDPDRAPRFFRVMESLNAEGKMCDLDDGPDQFPLSPGEISDAILRSLPLERFDLVMTHNPAGEYTRHRRHEEIGETVIQLWHAGSIQANELWVFAYEDGDKQYLPQPIQTAHLFQALTGDLWRTKYDLITETYGFPKDGFEARTTPREEAFWRFTNPDTAQEWLQNKVFQRESSTLI
jgi:LmbE family N-acetylglucosaminyl deacetylase